MRILDPTPFPACAWPGCPEPGNHEWRGTHLCDGHWEGELNGVFS